MGRGVSVSDTKKSVARRPRLLTKPGFEEFQPVSSFPDELENNKAVWGDRFGRDVVGQDINFRSFLPVLTPLRSLTIRLTNDNELRLVERLNFGGDSVYARILYQGKDIVRARQLGREHSEDTDSVVSKASACSPFEYSMTEIKDAVADILASRDGLMHDDLKDAKFKVIGEVTDPDPDLFNKEPYLSYRQQAVDNRLQQMGYNF